MLVGKDGIQAVNKEDILIEISKERISIPPSFEAQSLVEDDEDDIMEEARKAWELGKKIGFSPDNEIMPYGQW